MVEPKLGWTHDGGSVEANVMTKAGGSDGGQKNVAEKEGGNSDRAEWQRQRAELDMVDGGAEVAERRLDHK